MMLIYANNIYPLKFIISGDKMNEQANTLGLRLMLRGGDCSGIGEGVERKEKGRG